MWPTMEWQRNRLPRCGMYWQQPPATPAIGFGLPHASSASEDIMMLRRVAMQADVVGFCARVQVTQEYHNDQLTPVEAIYVFPLDDQAAVTSMDIQIQDGKRIVADIEPKQKAKQIYDSAVAAGKQAALLEKERDDLYTVQVGSIQPGKSVSVRLEYVTELQVDDDRSLRFVYPVTMMPLYTNPIDDSANVHLAPRVSSSTVRAAPPLEVRVKFSMPSAIVRVDSESLHELKSQVQGKDADVSISDKSAALDEDLVLRVTCSDPHRPYVTRAVDPVTGKKAIMLAFQPQFTPELLTNAPATAVVAASPFVPGRAAAPDPLGPVPGTELHVLIDRSGSMNGLHMSMARQALSTLLRCLPADGSVVFDIVSFGSYYSALFDGVPQLYDQANLHRASQAINEMEADMNGTELEQPLRAILSRPKIRVNRCIMVISDGGVDNDHRVLQLVAEHATDTRVFSLGIGSGASVSLIRGLAERGLGEAEFTTDNEPMTGKVVKQVKRCLQPAVNDIAVQWHELQPLIDIECGIQNKLYANDRLLVFALLKDGADWPQAPVTVHLSAKMVTSHANVVEEKAQPHADVSAVAPVRQGRLLQWQLTMAPDAPAVANNLIHQLAIKALIRRHESSSDKPLVGVDAMSEDSLCKLATTYRLASKYTSFVAVEQEPVAAAFPGGPMQQRRVPIFVAKSHQQQPVPQAKSVGGFGFGFGSLASMSAAPAGYDSMLFGCASASTGRSAMPLRLHSSQPFGARASGLSLGAMSLGAMSLGGGSGFGASAAATSSNYTGAGTGFSFGPAMGTTGSVQQASGWSSTTSSGGSGFGFSAPASSVPAAAPMFGGFSASPTGQSVMPCGGSIDSLASACDAGDRGGAYESDVSSGSGWRDGGGQKVKTLGMRRPGLLHKGGGGGGKGGGGKGGSKSRADQAPSWRAAAELDEMVSLASASGPGAAEAAQPAQQQQPLTLDAIVREQNADGSWPAMFGVNVLKLTDAQMLHALAQLGIKDQAAAVSAGSALITACVLSLLQTKFSGRSHEWQDLANKARAWLRNMLSQQKLTTMDDVRMWVCVGKALMQQQ